MRYYHVMNVYLSLIVVFFSFFRNERKNRSVKDDVTDRQLWTISGLLNGGSFNEFLQAEGARELPDHALQLADRLLPLKPHVKVCCTTPLYLFGLIVYLRGSAGEYIISFDMGVRSRRNFLLFHLLLFCLIFRYILQLHLLSLFSQIRLIYASTTVLILHVGGLL